MNTKLNIKNFRIFNDKGVDVDLKPITILTGCNSSGKSSIVKALTLLKTFFQHEYDLQHPVIGATIDFSTKPNNSLGSFNNVVNSSSKEKSCSFSYDIHSKYINNDVTVTLTIEEGNIGNGKVSGISISLKNGETIISVNGKDYNGKLYLLKEAFKQYLVAICYREQVNLIMREDYEEWFMGLSENERKALEKKTSPHYEKALRYCDKNYLEEVFSNNNIEVCHYIKKNLHANKNIPIIEKYAETGIMTYFSIFDEMANLSDAEEIKLFLKSKIKENKLKSTIEKAIDVICKDYSQGSYKNFLEYYRSKEESRQGLNHIPGFDRVLNFSVFNINYSPFTANHIDYIYSIYEAKECEKKGEPYHIFWAEEVWKNVNYSLVYSTLSQLSEEDVYSASLRPLRDDGFRDKLSYKRSPYLYCDVFNDFFNKFLSEITSTDVTEDIAYVSSSRIQIRRLYSMEDRTDFSDSVRRYFETKTKFLSLNPPITLNIDYGRGRPVPLTVSDFMPGSFMDKWLKAFNIGDHISLEMDTNGLGLLLKIYSSENDKEGRLLADLGYGVTQLFSILLEIEEKIMAGLYNEFNGRATSKKDGTGRVIPNYNYKEKPLEPQTIAIEEPEIHLHPKYQSLMAEMFATVYRTYNIHFLIETHSEYLIRKLQNLVATQDISQDDVSLLYVGDSETGEKEVRKIEIAPDGRLKSAFGPGFFDEADSLAMNLLMIKGRQA